jgi:hypothetical protein
VAGVASVGGLANTSSTQVFQRVLTIGSKKSTWTAPPSHLDVHGISVLEGGTCVAPHAAAAAAAAAAAVAALHQLQAH